MMKSLLGLTFASLFLSFVYSNDETLVKEAKGTGVVEAVCSKIGSSCIFEDDRLMLRRIAFVETNDGLDANTYRAGYDGGIWQVDEQQLGATQASFSINNEKLEIMKQFGIDWGSVTWSDLRKPFYSGLAARLFLHFKSSSLPRSINDQARFWKQYYRIDANRSETEFVTKSNNIQTDCRRKAADVLYVLDESGSIGIDNFQEMKDFLIKVTVALNIGPDPIKDTRVSVLKFSNSANLLFNFEKYSTTADYISAIGNMSYNGGGTNTADALKFLRTSAFDSTSGARQSGIPRIAIVLTDGESNDQSQTLLETYELHKTDITVVAVGVGTGVNVAELKAIATDPDCKNVILLKGFDEFINANEIIEKKTCEAPLVFTPGGDGISTIPAGESRPCKISIQPSGTTIEVTSSNGNTVVYFSNTTVPSSSYYDIKLDLQSNSPVILHIPYLPVNNGTSYAYCFILGNPNSDTTLNIKTCEGDCDPCNKKSCPSNQICSNKFNWTFQCTSPSYNCDNNNPCTPVNAAKQLFYFPHEETDKFVQCSEWGQCFIMPCPPGQIWNVGAYTCTPPNFN